MIYEASPIAVGIFLGFVILVLGISFYFGRKTKSAKGFFAAGGRIHWSVNGIAFAGDYLSAASFLGICGMIATMGYDGFLYSIGFLAGWIVALFVIAEPIKKLGKYTFTDALDAKFDSKGIKAAAAISTLIVSIFYLIPQMVGAGALVTPLLGFPHWVGVVIVGVIVIIIVATAGMASTTYVQFIKGGLLVVFSIVLVVILLANGLSTTPNKYYHHFETLNSTIKNGELSISDSNYKIAGEYKNDEMHFVKLENNGIFNWWKVEDNNVKECLSKTINEDGSELYNGEPKKNRKFYPIGHIEHIIMNGKEVDDTGPLGIFSFLSVITKSDIIRYPSLSFKDGNNKVTVWYPTLTHGNEMMRPGLNFKVDKGSTPVTKLNFVSLMLALFFGTAALPHILIRYYTVPNPSSARKSTIVAIGAIGLFYILTLFMGLGAATNGVIDVESSNMAAPLLAKNIGLVLFAIISAIAFATILGTVSGLIVASSGAVAHDIVDKLLKVKLTDKSKVIVGKISAIAVGLVAIVFGILLKGMNVSFLVGLAFAVAASANFPSIIMMLFWKKTTKRGITVSIITGIVSAVAIILQSPSMLVRYGLDASGSLIPLDNPAIISMPLSFIALIVVSLLTQKHNVDKKVINNI